MCFISKLNSAPRKRTVAVDWHDCAWSPAITVQTPPERVSITKRLPALPPILHTARCHPAHFKNMKTILPSARRHRAGFTLIELLVVIAIIGILAAMLLPVLQQVVKHAKMVKAKTEAKDIATAITAYDSAYGRFPTAQTPGAGDFTYGDTLLTQASPNGLGSGTWATNNSEVIAILMDSQTMGGGVNNQHVRNPKQTIFLNAKLTDYPGAASTPPPGGVDQNGIYRDPWGNPYIITMDLNYDEQTKDAFYSQKAVSNGGINGLVDPTDSTGNDNNYEYHDKVMVWSAGPDGKIDVNSAANLGANKDNVTSW